MLQELSSLSIDFINAIGGAIFVAVIYGAFFYVLFLFTDKGKPGDYKNFGRADPDHKFLNSDFKIEFSYYMFNKLVTGVLLYFVITFMTIYLLQKYVPFEIFSEHINAMPFVVQVLLGLFIADVVFFLPHWFSHKFLWRFHSIHHAAEHLSWITALRLHPVDVIPFSLGAAIILHVIGFQGEAMITAILIHDTYNVFVHCNITLNYPKPLCYILGSPNYHRWHHAAEKEAIDKNFATMFPIFDLLAGTYYHPDRLPKRYGLFEVEQKDFPKTFGGQLLYPFKKRK